MCIQLKCNYNNFPLIGTQGCGRIFNEVDENYGKSGFKFQQRQKMLSDFLVGKVTEYLGDGRWLYQVEQSRCPQVGLGGCYKEKIALMLCRNREHSESLRDSSFMRQESDAKYTNTTCMHIKFVFHLSYAFVHIHTPHNIDQHNQKGAAFLSLSSKRI